MIHWAEPNYPDYYDDRGAPPLRKICAYCGELIASAAERGRHVSINFRLPDCQFDILNQIQPIGSEGEPIGSLPARESHIRPLAALESPQQRAEVWQQGKT